jgi:H+/Cl- antiporter ClcA
VEEARQYSAVAAIGVWPVIGLVLGVLTAGAVAWIILRALISGNVTFHSISYGRRDNRMTYWLLLALPTVFLVLLCVLMIRNRAVLLSIIERAS